MPYYQFANLTARTRRDRRLPADRPRRLAHRAGAHRTVRRAADRGRLGARGPDPASRGGRHERPANGKYLATLACVTCHTANATGRRRTSTRPKAFQGGKIVTATVSGTSKSVQTSNLTPDATGLMSWNVSQVAAAITTGKDKNGATICGMRALANMTSSDAIDIGTYLLGIPAVANAITMTCQ